MSGAHSATAPSRDDAALTRVFLDRLTEHLEGRRVLPRTDAGLEPEPATLAQLAGYRRLAAALDAASSQGAPASVEATAAADRLLACLVQLLARQPGLHVAEWPEAEAALDALAALIEALPRDPAPPERPVDRGPA